jgi:LuxR family transcriptional regulator, quorum-sensing system regulator BjaR1
MSKAMDILHEIDRPWTEDLLTAALGEIAEAYGYRHFAVFNIPSADDARTELKLLVGNWEPAFLKAYEKLGLMRFTPVIRALKSGPTPFAWDVEMLHGMEEPGQANPPARLLSDHGFLGGVYVPVHGLNSFQGAIAFAGLRTEITEEEAGELQLAAFMIFGILSACRFDDNRRSNPLTGRERDCLKLAMLGKTSSEIGTILSLSEYTVSQYLGSATRKVNASNRTHAVAIAAQMGYLS